MSPSYTIDYHHLLENILDTAIQVFLSAICTLCSLLSPSRCPVTPRTSTISSRWLPTPSSLHHDSQFHHLYTDGSHTHTWRSTWACSLTLGGAHTASQSPMRQGPKRGDHLAETSDGSLGLHYVTLCICICLKISIIKRLFFFFKEDPSEPSKNSKERSSQLKIGVFMRDILSSFEEK